MIKVKIMPQARINGQNVEVTKTKVGEGTPAQDIVYTIAGEGAAGLHATLKEISVEPSDLVGGSFTVKKSALIDSMMDMPFLKRLDSRLDAAASGLEVK